MEQDLRKIDEKTKLAAYESHLIKNILVVVFSVLIAIFLAYNGVFERILAGSKESELIGSFVAGIFFTSLLTAATATVVLAEIAQENSVFLVALFGGLGSIIGDVVIFKFLKSHINDEFIYLFSHHRGERFSKIFHLKSFRWLMGFLGAVAIASPLPDELGLSLLGISQLKTKYIIPISFVLNTAGILIVALIAKQLI